MYGGSRGPRRTLTRARTGQRAVSRSVRSRRGRKSPARRRIFTSHRRQRRPRSPQREGGGKNALGRTVRSATPSHRHRIVIAGRPRPHRRGVADDERRASDTRRHEARHQFDGVQGTYARENPFAASPRASVLLD